jgi:hypothetical protein
MNKLSVFLGLVLLATAPLAHAGMELNYSINGGATVTCGPVAGANPSVLCGNVAGPTFDITFLGATSNSPGGTPSQEESATVDISNVTGATQSIVINVISTGFTSPTAPPGIDLLSNIGGSVATGSSLSSLSFVSCLDTTNSQTAGCSGTTINAPALSPSITSQGAYSADNSTAVNTLASPYAIDQALKITLGAGSNVNFSASTTLVATPEPTSIVLFGAVIFLTGSAIRRKQKRQASRV